jgi:hypothetical protein
MLLALVGQRTAPSCCLCQSSSSSSSSRLGLGLAAHHRRHHHHHHHHHHHRLSSSPRPTSGGGGSGGSRHEPRHRRALSSTAPSHATHTTTRQRRLLPLLHQGGGGGGIVSSQNGRNGEGAKKIALLAGSAAAAAAVTAAASWFALKETRSSSSSVSRDEGLEPTTALLPSFVAHALWQQQQQQQQQCTTNHRTTRCEEGPGPPHFRSAASLFQHHMSKEKEKDDANDYRRDDEGDHHDEEQQDAQQSKEPECFLCRVHRQGPCGSMWKDLEACVLQQEKSSHNNSNANASHDPCKGCAAQFEACWKKHAGLYSLIALEEQATDLHTLRKQHDVMASDSPLSSATVNVEWDAWNQFLSNSPAASSDIVKKYRRHISQNGNVRFRGPLWKRFEKYHMTNPLLVRVSVRIPRSIRTNQQERVVYAVALDQQNRVLGFVEVGGDPTSTARHDAHDGDSNDNFVNMKIIIVPGLTESVKIQLWTTLPSSSSAHGGAASASSPTPRGTKGAITIRETVSQPVDYGASTNSMLALQNQRTRTEKVKSTAAS